MQVIGADAYNGTAGNLRSFQSSTGTTYPLLLNAGSSTGGNMNVLYGPNDSHIIINKQGIVRYNTVLRYAHYNRYHLDEIRTVIDSLVSNVAGVGDVPVPRGFSLRANPNPFRGNATIELANPNGARRTSITLHDVSGRRVATLWDGPAPAGMTRVEWDGRSFGGQSMPAGIYLVRARIDDTTLSRRIVRIR